VFACVGNDNDLRSVTIGENGAFAGLKMGSIFVDHTTTSAGIARELHAIASAAGKGYVDAPVSGGQSGAENGTLTVMCGGTTNDFARVAPAISAYAQTCRLMGAVGSGQLTKMTNQICLAGIVEGLAEGLSFAKRAGLDPNAVVEVISKGAAQSWQMDNRHKTMIEGTFDFGFAVHWMRKDLLICLDEARRNGSSLPGTALIDQFYADVELMDGRNWDTSSLIKRFK
jgi:3-hydroxyisobutyrate dehydrogenase